MCEVLRLDDGAEDQPILQLSGQDLRVTDKFIYLGLPICASGIDKLEWRARAKRKANIAVANLRRLGLHRRGFSWQNSVYLYKTFVRPTMEYGLALMPPTRSLVSELERIQMDVLREAARARRNTSKSVLMRMSGCTELYQRARELAAGWLAKAENATADRGICWFFAAAQERNDWNKSIFMRIADKNQVITFHRADVLDRRHKAWFIRANPAEAWLRRWLAGQEERRRQRWAIRPPPDDVIMARTLRACREIWWVHIRRKDMENAYRDGRGTVLSMAFNRLYYPVPLIKYKGPAWVTGLLLLWWTGRLPSYSERINCSKCQNGYRSRLHVLVCHRIRERLAVMDDRDWEERRFTIDRTVHPIDKVLKRLPVFSLDDRKFRVVMAILKEMAYHDHRLNPGLYQQLEGQMAPLPPQPDRHWRMEYPYMP